VDSGDDDIQTSQYLVGQVKVTIASDLNLDPG
jgi:hypothetical protein